MPRRCELLRRGIARNIYHLILQLLLHESNKLRIDKLKKIIIENVHIYLPKEMMGKKSINLVKIKSN